VTGLRKCIFIEWILLSKLHIANIGNRYDNLLLLIKIKWNIILLVKTNRRVYVSGIRRYSQELW